MASSTPLPNLAGSPWLVSESVQVVLEMLESAGEPARVVGGAVRNALIGRPVEEVDIATTAVPERTIEVASRHGLQTVPTGIEHGTVTVIVHGTPIEVTALRRDVETDGRRAVVAFTREFREDAMRRDFTMNALYCDAHGAVFDPLDGWSDLVARKVRFIGEAAERIREDYLRILRFFRFNAVLGSGPLDSDGLAACVKHQDGLAGLSAERLRSELLRLLAGRNAVHVVRIMAARGILSAIGVPDFGVERFAQLADIELHVGRSPDPLLRLALLAMAVDPNLSEPGLDAASLSARLRLSNSEAKRLKALGSIELASPSLTEDQRLECLYRWGDASMRDRLLIAWAVSGAAADSPAWMSLLAWIGKAERPEFPVRGRDLSRIGVSTGPQMGELLKRLETRWIDGGFSHGRDELIDYAKRLQSAN